MALRFRCRRFHLAPAADAGAMPAVYAMAAAPLNFSLCHAFCRFFCRAAVYFFLLMLLSDTRRLAPPLHAFTPVERRRSRLHVAAFRMSLFRHAARCRARFVAHDAQITRSASVVFHATPFRVANRYMPLCPL